MASVKNVLKRFNALLIFSLFVLISVFSMPFSLTQTQSVFVSTSNYQASIYSSSSPFQKLINWLFPWTEQNSTSNANLGKEIYVYAGGTPLGFTLECEGVVIVGTSDVLTKKGSVNPTAQSNITVGDVLYSIEGNKIYGAEMIENIVNLKENAGKSLKVQIRRNGMEFETTINPALDLATGVYKLGLWIRDNAAGVGTLTYIRKDNGRFGALGHPVCDVDTGSILPINSGSIYVCNIIGVAKGERGKPGELRGLFLKGGDEIGALDNNTSYGVFGSVENEYYNNLNGEELLVASRNEVKLGNATLRCTVDGMTPKDYSIEIIKSNQSTSKDQKNMVIRITDSELLAKTGGIVQGMSGSPIIQNGKLIGAVTHVFVSDPTKGFATFIDNMIES